MLKRENRLTNKEFSLYRKGEIYKTHLFSIKIIYNNQNINKLGIIIAKKNIKNSSTRNSLKRKIYFYYYNVINKKEEINFKNIKNESKVIIITYIKKRELDNLKQKIKQKEVNYEEIKRELDQVFVKNNIN